VSSCFVNSRSSVQIRVSAPAITNAEAGPEGRLPGLCVATTTHVRGHHIGTPGLPTGAAALLVREWSPQLAADRSPDLVVRGAEEACLGHKRRRELRQPSLSFHIRKSSR
jgi:hypothetical protein